MARGDRNAARDAARAMVVRGRARELGLDLPDAPDAAPDALAAALARGGLDRAARAGLAHALHRDPSLDDLFEVPWSHAKGLALAVGRGASADADVDALLSALGLPDDPALRPRRVAAAAAFRRLCEEGLVPARLAA